MCVVNIRGWFFCMACEPNHIFHFQFHRTYKVQIGRASKVIKKSEQSLLRGKFFITNGDWGNVERFAWVDLKFEVGCRYEAHIMTYRMLWREALHTPRNSGNYTSARLNFHLFRHIVVSEEKTPKLESTSFLPLPPQASVSLFIAAWMPFT